MKVLLDTNILLRLAHPFSSHGPIAAAAVAALLNRGYSLHLVPQNFYEFLVVVTRPLQNNGLGMTAIEAKSRIDSLKSAIPVLYDNEHVTHAWEKFVVDHDAKGKTAHDARLVASMIAHGLYGLLTFNVSDFTRYSQITVIDPAGLSRQSP